METIEIEATPQAARRGLTGSTLKLIAIVTMLIDHAAVVFIEQGILYTNSHVLVGGFWLNMDLFFRYGFGRLAFPIFCFLMVEGFFNTHDRKKYALRLGLFCLVSELPFDWALFGTPFDWHGKHQNVFFTLCIGFCTIWVMETLKNKDWKPCLRRLTMVGALAAAAALAQCLRTDYGAIGIVIIALFYLFRARPKWQRNVVCSVATIWELTAPLALIPIHFYNGQRGLRLKYVFYLFYPVHLLLLGLIAKLAFGV